MYCFEAMPSSINYQKSDVFVLQATVEEERKVADMFNCNTCDFPLKYLGIMLQILYEFH